MLPAFGICGKAAGTEHALGATIATALCRGVAPEASTERGYYSDRNRFLLTVRAPFLKPGGEVAPNRHPGHFTLQEIAPP